ncbi:lipopolysaccharide biosynthesis protein [Weissella confusa]|uniref:lipopolysaccharide biosynthesis protein n=1 Tax=Weissella confusa TaxID=1583 RepID=UPI0022FE8996|nr:lipopolysaccharide biosynthesis protein [Weissella confusa]MDA5457396.1 repeat unit transporter [Weissella confusa]
MNRTKAASINALTVLITQFLGLFLKFAVQTVLIHTLSQSYVGLNGLFANVISFLSFADLGIGAAITVALYRPIAEENVDEIRTLLAFYRKVYFVIGTTITVVGIVVAPFLHFAIKGNTFGNGQITWWFIIYLGGTVATYFSAYKRSFLMAEQRGYISSVNDFVFKSIQQIAQILALVWAHSFLLFLIAQLVFVVLSNVQLSLKASKIHPDLFNKLKTKKMDAYFLNEIKKNVVGSISSKIGAIVVFGTDNFLLSAFVGLVSVAKYSNYMLVIQSLNSIFSQTLSAIIASIGNLNITSDAEHQENVMFNLMYLNAAMNVFLVTGLGFGIDYFIELWAGVNYKLDSWTVFIILLNFLVNQFRYTVQNFISGMGLYWQLRWKSLIEAAVNFVISFLLMSLFHMGILGVVLGTLSSNLLVNAWWEPLIVYKHGLKKTAWTYVFKYIKYMILSTVALSVSMTISAQLHFDNILELIIRLALVEVVVMTMFVVVTIKSTELKYFISLIRRKIR